MLGAGFIGAGVSGFRRRNGATARITAAIVPASSNLVAGQSLSDTVNWAIFTNPSNYIANEVGQMISSVVVNYTGDTNNASDLFVDGDLNEFTLTVTDTAGNVRTFAVIPRSVAYTPPAVVGTLEDQTLIRATGPQIYDTAPAFTGADLSFAVSGPAGVLIDPATGVVTFDTDMLMEQTATGLTVTASNSGGSVDVSFALTIGSAVVYTADIAGPVNNPTHGQTAQIGTPLTGQIAPTQGSEIIVHRWLAEGVVITGATSSDYTPIASDDLALVQYAPLVDGEEVASTAVRVRYAPPVAGSLAPVAEVQGSGTPTVNLSAGFTGEALVFSEAVSWGSVSGSVLTLDDEVRTDVLTLTATNSGGAAQLDLSVTITAPVVSVSNAIADQSFVQDSGDVTIDLDTVFTNATSYSVTGAGASVSGATLTLSDDTLRAGAVITVTGTNGFNSANDVFALTVSEADAGGTFSGEEIGNDPVITVDESNPNALSFSVTGGNHPGTYSLNKADGDASITAATLAAAPACLALPGQTGTATGGGTQTGVPGLWVYAGADPGDQTFEWIEDGVASGDTDLSFTPAGALSSPGLVLQETFDGVTVSSAATAIVAQPTTFSRVVFVGGSIMQDMAAATQLTQRSTTIETAFSNEGATVEVYNNAQAGDDLALSTVRLQDAMDEFPTDTLFFVHAGGNDVSAGRPYPGGDTAFAADLEDLIDVAATRPGTVIISDLTFRDYNETTAANESAGSKPYNDNILLPACLARVSDLAGQAYYADGRAVSCLYEFILSNHTDYLDGTHVHMTAAGNLALTDWLAERLAPVCLGNAIPAEATRVDWIADTFGDANWSVATGSATNELDVTISSLPDDNGSPIRDVEYDVDGAESWASLPSYSGTGTYALTMAAADTEYAITLRAVNDAGSSAEGNPESATSQTSDVTAPTLSGPTDASDGQTASTASVSTDQGNGTLYWVVSQSAIAPTAAQVKIGQDNSGSAATDSGSQAVSGTGVQMITPAPSGLTAATTYTTHFMHEDAATNQSTVATASGFTTVSAAFAPPGISGLKLWLDATDSGTITAAGSGAVSHWADKSGNGNDFAQSNSSLRPVTGTDTLNSLNTIRFNSALKQYLTRADALGVTGSPALTVLMALEIVSDVAGLDPFFYIGSESASGGTGIMMTGGTAGYSYRHNNGARVFGATTTGAGLILAYNRISGANYSQQYFRENGGAIPSSTGGGATVPVLPDERCRIGSVPSGGAVNIKLGEILVYSADLSLADMDDAVAYLGSKWGVTVSTVV